MRKKIGFAGASALAVTLLLMGGAVEAADENGGPDAIDVSGKPADRGAFNGGAAEDMKNLKAEAGKIGPLLYGLYLERTASQRGESVRKSGDQLSAAPLPVEGGLILIDAIAAGSAQHLLADLETMGLQQLRAGGVRSHAGGAPGRSQCHGQPGVRGALAEFTERRPGHDPG